MCVLMGEAAGYSALRATPCLVNTEVELLEHTPQLSRSILVINTDHIACVVAGENLLGILSSNCEACLIDYVFTAPPH